MRVRAPVALAAVAVLLAGCGAGSQADAGSGSITVTNCGRQVTVPHQPRRVFAERDTSTALAAVGAADRIVARSGEGDLPLGRYHDQLARVPQITPNVGDPPPPETVAGQRPDLVVAGHLSGQDVQALEALRIPVLVPDWYCSDVFGGSGPVRFTDTYRTLETLGRVFGTARVADAAVADLQRRVAAVQQRFAAHPPRTAADVYLSPSQLYAYGRPSVNNAVLGTLGLTNVFADLTKRDPPVDGETVVGRNPAVLVISYGPQYGIGDGAQATRVLAAMPGLARLDALRNRRVVTLNYSYLTGGPLTVDGMEMIADQLTTFSR